jgi:hypothetical protein
MLTSELLMSDKIRTFGALWGGRVRFPRWSGFLLSWFHFNCQECEIWPPKIRHFVRLKRSLYGFW